MSDDRKRAMDYALELQKMIREETVSVSNVEQREKFERFHDVLRSLFPHVFSTCEVKDFEGSLLLRWAAENPKGDPVLLMSHQDVVAADAESWIHPPFSGFIDEKERTIWGRGTVDTKGSLYCIFKAFDELIAEGFHPPVDLYIASSCGEEVQGPGAPTIAHYLKEKGVHLQLLMDEGGMIMHAPLKGADGTFAMMGCLERGTGNFTFIARGKGGHASAPGRNTPLVRLASFILDVERSKKFPAKMNSVTLEMFRRIGPTMKGGLGFVLRHAKFFTPLLLKVMPRVNPAAGAMVRTTIAFTTARGSDGLNVLPKEAYVTGNTRFIHHQGVEATRRVLEEIARKHDIEVETMTAEEPAPVVDFTTPVFRMLEDTVKSLFPHVIPCPYAMTGGTDARSFSIVTENAIRFAPLFINEQQYESIHGVNENIGIDALTGGVDFYKRVLRQVGQ